MPKRTNRFQEIVAAIEQAFAPKCARVNTSEMIRMKDIGVFREIDVTVEVGPSHRRVKIAVEAKDHGRKLDVTAIETIIGKYRGQGCVPIDKVVVVASRGFTKTAHEKAKLEDITLLTLQETHEFDWVTIGANLTPLAFP
ncbi:MAG TPA: restriction endonuclease, partial [Sumerlaeia bacterium]|nr:restriction endonuclease [Sumerlaeia bacterium]